MLTSLDWFRQLKVTESMDWYPTTRRYLGGVDERGEHGEEGAEIPAREVAGERSLRRHQRAGDEDLRQLRGEHQRHLVNFGRDENLEEGLQAVLQREEHAEQRARGRALGRSPPASALDRRVVTAILSKVPRRVVDEDGARPALRTRGC